MNPAYELDGSISFDKSCVSEKTFDPSINEHRLVFLLVLFFACGTSFTKLRINSATRNGHYYRLHGPELIIGYPLFLGHAKLMLHSRIAVNSHRRSHVDHERGLRLQNLVIASRIIKLVKSLSLLLW
jgi:hypothetical protein